MKATRKIAATVESVKGVLKNLDIFCSFAVSGLDVFLCPSHCGFQCSNAARVEEIPGSVESKTPPTWHALIIS
jgi:hypothetical protein